jgi:dipeptide/tripeptide permease
MKNEEQRLPLRETLRVLARASRGYWAVNLVNFGSGITYFGVLHLLVLYLENDIAMGASWASRAVSTFAGIVTVGMFLGGGFVSDWLGVRRALTLALVLGLLGRILLVVAPDAGWGNAVIALAWCSLVIMGLGEAVIQPAIYAGVKEYSDQRTATMGYALIYAVMNLGLVVEQSLSPLIRDYARVLEGTEGNPAGGIAGVYWVLVVITAVLLVSHLLLFTRGVELTQRMASAEPHETRRSAMKRLRSIPVLDRRFLFFIFILLPVRTLFAHQWLTVPGYIMRCFPATVGERYELVMAVNPAIIVIGVPLIAACTRHVSIITMMLIGTSISALSTALLLPEPSLFLLVAYMICFSIGEAVWSSRFLEYVAQLAPPGRVGAYMGIATLPWFLAKFTTGWYSGWLLEVFIPTDGPQQPGQLWLLYGAVALISPIGLFIGRKWVRTGVPTPQTS